MTTISDGFLQAVEAALELGEGYAVIQLDPDGLRVSPVIHSEVDVEVTLRKVVRNITRIVWGQGKPLVAAAKVGGEDELPSSVNPSGPALTSFLDTANEQLA